jgi:hypothetical protein
MVVIDRPSDRQRRSRKKDGIYVFEASTRREQEKKRKGGENEEEEGCTYTNAIARVRRNDGRVFSSVLLAVVLLLTRTRCAYCHHHQHHLSFFFNKHVGSCV